MLLLAYFALGMVQIRHASITFDEGPHLAIGYTTLRTGDFRLQPVHIHPPLANIFAGAPLLLQHDIPDPRNVAGWDINSLSAVTDAVVWQYPHPRRIATAGRVPILLLGILLGAIISRWAKDLGGKKASVLALALYAFDPNFIAHGSLITTDMAAALLIVATLYVVNSKWQMANGEEKQEFSVKRSRKQRLRLMCVGVLLGLAQLAKVSTLMLIPVIGLILLVDAMHINHQTSNVKHLNNASRITHHALRITHYLLPKYAILFFTAAFVLWAGYGFQITSVPGWPFDIPAGTHIRIFQSLYTHYDIGHPTFALGKVSEHGWWWYFPLAFALKTPLPILILTVWAISRFTFHVSKKKPTTQTIVSQFLSPQTLSLWLFPSVYALSSLFSTVNIGYRHLLPILPFLYIGIGQMGNGESRNLSLFFLGGQASLARRATFYILLLWLAVGTLATLPYPLTFFNALAGGAQNGYRYLVDSNLDWGQNLWDLQAWMETHNETHVYYAHYSPARPQVYGIRADFLPPDPRAVNFAPWHPEQGLYAIGATVLQGPYAPDLNTYAWFRNRKPDAQLGHALFIYHVPPQPPPAWAAVCSDISANTLKDNLGVENLRILQPECAQTYVYPQESAPGIYFAAGNMETPPNANLDILLRDANETSYAAVYAIETPPTPQKPMDIVAPDGPLTFKGYTLHATDQVWTYWQVVGIPDRPLSLMAHLIGPDGTAAAVGDGLGFPIEQWQIGDLIVQRHTLAPPPDAAPGPYTLHIGAYWLDTMARWPLQIQGHLEDHVALQTLEVHGP